MREKNLLGTHSCANALFQGKFFIGKAFCGDETTPNVLALLNISTIICVNVVYIAYITQSYYFPCIYLLYLLPVTGGFEKFFFMFLYLFIDI